MSRVVDLSLAYENGIRGFDWEVAKTVATHGWNARTLHFYSHSGTHMDSQRHFDAGDETIDVIPASRFISRSWLVDLGEVKPKSLIEVEHLGDVQDRFTPGESLVLKSGWSRYVRNPEVYRDGLPRVSEGLARWCVEKKVNVLGVEAPSVADVNDSEEVTRIHKILLGGKVLIVEGLANLDAVQSQCFRLIAFPLKIKDGDGSPCRVVAVVD